MADEARSLKAYGELPESSACPSAIRSPPRRACFSVFSFFLVRGIPQLTLFVSLSRPVRVNETDTFDEERNENDDFFDFDDGATTSKTVEECTAEAVFVCNAVICALVPRLLE